MYPLLDVLGGIGLFLYGMAALTSGLQQLAGEKLRQWLSRSTRTPLRGVAMGAATTAVVQSSSATTVAAVGFVGAGLLTFEQTLGIIFGANIGTTITGWMVAMIGFKLKLSVVALPLLFVASILYLFKSYPRMRGAGKALAGFCLLFLGISYLQQGLADYRDVIDLGRWQADHMGNRLMLVLVGGVLTLITQSSSASVATALTALNASVLTLPQAAAVIIGADIGTTVTAAFATVGGTAASRRTGFAHVIYNVITGVAAFLVLPLYLWGVGKWMPDALESSQEVVAVGFHTLFNSLGVLLAVPFTTPFARLIVRLFPDRNSPLEAPFDEALLKDPYAAIEALARGAQALALGSQSMAVDTLAGEQRQRRLSQEASLLAGIDRARTFALLIDTRTEERMLAGHRLIAALHVIDHAERLIERSRDEKRARHARQMPEFTALTREVRIALNEGGLGVLEEIATTLEEDRSGFRARLIAKATQGGISADQLDQGLDCHRWLRRVVYHAWRLAVYRQASEAKG
jgi:phosphate:Na+ symporter